MENDITRRRMLQIGGAALGGAVLYGANSLAKTENPGNVPWTWREMEPESIKERAYKSAWARIGCMYGVVESILGTLGDKYGAPYNTFPVAATIYGSGGVGGVGSLCGTVNAAGLLFGLFIEKEEDYFPLCNEISLWYEKTSMPVYKPLKPVQDIPIVASVSGSNLCHVSCTRWSKVSGHKLMTMAHFERCNRLVSDVAMKIVTMLNQYSNNKMVFNEKPNSFSEGCMSCHGPENEKGDVSANMSCDSCHDNPH